MAGWVGVCCLWCIFRVFMTGWVGVCCLRCIFCFRYDRMGRRVLLVIYIPCLLWQDGSACGAGDVYFVFVMAGGVGVWRWWCIFCFCYGRMGRRVLLVMYILCLLWQDGSVCGAGDVYFVFVMAGWVDVCCLWCIFRVFMTGWVGVCRWWCIFCFRYDRMGRRVLLVRYILFLLWQDGSTCVACDVYFVFVMTGWVGVWRWWCIFCVCYGRMGRRVLLVMYILCLLWQDGSVCGAGDVYFMFVMAGWVGVCRLWCIFCFCYGRMGRRVSLVMYILCLLWQDGTACGASDVYFVFVMAGWVGVCRLWCIFCFCYGRMGRRVSLVMYILCLLWQDGTACGAGDVYFVFVMAGWVDVCCLWCIFCVCYGRMGRRVALVMYILCLLWQDGSACVAGDVYFVFVMTGWVGVWRWWCIFCVCYGRMGRRVSLVMYILCLLWQDGSVCGAGDVYFVFVMIVMYILFLLWQDGSVCGAGDVYFVFVMIVMYILFLLWQDGSACGAGDVYFVFVMIVMYILCLLWQDGSVCGAGDVYFVFVMIVMYILFLLWQDGSVCGAGDVYFVFVMIVMYILFLLWQDGSACGSGDVYFVFVMIVMYILFLLWQDGSACGSDHIHIDHSQHEPMQRVDAQLLCFPHNKMSGSFWCYRRIPNLICDT